MWQYTNEPIKVNSTTEVIRNMYMSTETNLEEFPSFIRIELCF